MGNDIARGYDFSGSSPNNLVTAEKLNTLVDEAEIKTTFVSSKEAVVETQSDDVLLLLRGSVYKKVTVGNAITAARGRPGATNLKIVWASNSSVSVTADYVLMRNATNGNLYLTTSFSVTADFSNGVAVNGLDTGVEAANTWYYLHAISDGTNDRLIITANANGPTLPTGYVYSAFLGALQNDNSSNLRFFMQHGSNVTIENPYDGTTTGDSRHLNPQTNSADFTSVAPVSADTLQAVSLARCVPPNIVASVTGIIGVTGNTAVTRYVSIATNGSGNTLSAIGNTTGHTMRRLVGFVPTTTSANANPGSSFGFQDVAAFTVPVRDSQQIVWASSSSTGSIHTMRITGYTLA